MHERLLVPLWRRFIWQTYFEAGQGAAATANSTSAGTSPLETQNAALKAAAPKQDPKLGPQKIAQLEKQNANLKAELSKLRARVDQNTKDNKQNANSITRFDGLRAPIQALVRSFKQTPGAPFTTWRMWMLSTFRKQGVYRKQMFR